MEMRILLDKGVGPYSPGEILLGKVIVVKSGVSLLPKPLGLHIQFEGKASVKFTLADRWGRGGYKGRWRTCSDSETYFHSAHYLIGDGLGEVVELGGGGVAEFPFTFTLPPVLPSSYKGSHGSVDYSVSVILKRSWGVNKEVNYPFQVNSHLDVATARQMMRGGGGGGGGGEGVGSMRKSERVGMLWWGGTVFVHFNLRKKTYIPGDHLFFYAQIINDSKSSLHKAKLLLTQEVRYIAQGSSHTVTHILKKVKGPGVKGGERRINWEDPTALKIPSLPPTTLGGDNRCSIIQINYFVHLLVQPFSLGFKDRTLVCKLPIVLGTKRGTGARDSWCYGEGEGINRVGSLFGTLERREVRSAMTSPTSTLGGGGPGGGGGGGGGDWSYYQNVIFPLNRCFSAPLYENHRFRPQGHVSPWSLQEQEEQEDQGDQGEEEEDGDITPRPEPPPTYEEAMLGEYQNSSTLGGMGVMGVRMTSPPAGLPSISSPCTSPFRPPPHSPAHQMSREPGAGVDPIYNN